MLILSTLIVARRATVISWTVNLENLTSTRAATYTCLRFCVMRD